MTDRSRRPTERQMITAGIQMLRGGTPPSALPGELMVRFSISAEKAKAVAVEAVDRFKKDTKPLDEPDD
jgi:hypothetical protein